MIESCNHEKHIRIPSCIINLTLVDFNLTAEPKGPSAAIQTLMIPKQLYFFTFLEDKYLREWP